MTPAECFGGNLKRARRRADLSQEDLARRAALHRTEIGLLENGLRTPRIDTMAKLAAAVEASPDELMEGIAWVVPDLRDGSFVVSPVRKTLFRTG
jgi:transcriptional regulator with XRE-family HTH domain